MYPRNPNTSSAPTLTAIAICMRVNPILREILSGWQLTARLLVGDAGVHVLPRQETAREQKEKARSENRALCKNDGNYSFLSSASSLTGSIPPSCWACASASSIAFLASAI